MSHRKVGIVVLNFNSSAFLRYLLDSLLKAKTNVRFEVGVIDNNSEEDDAAAAKRHFDAFLEQGGMGFFVCSSKNLGFSGGNNAVVSRFLKDPEITHLCMLNSDVLVTDYWLDYLTEDDYDVTGPVTNATGNEQTIAVDYDVTLNGDAFQLVNDFSHYRYQTYGKSTYESDVLYFFNTVVSRRVIEKIGLLDERFYPGSYEDVDYCLRIKQAGFKQMIIRGCFVHHFGSGSFSKLDMPDRINISNINRSRFEEKWNTHWEGDAWRMLQSCRQDMETFQAKPLDARSSSLICKAIIAAETLIKNWAAGIEWYQSDQYAENLIRQHMEQQNEQCVTGETSAQTTTQEGTIKPVTSVTKHYVGFYELSGKLLLNLVWKKCVARLHKMMGSAKYEQLRNRSYQFVGVPYPTLPLDMMSGKQMMKRAAKLLLCKIGLMKKTKKISVELTAPETAIDLAVLDAAEYNSATQDLGRALATAKQKVCIQAPMFTKENERDGYIQRIKRVDEEIFDGYLRLYVYDDGKRANQIHVDKIDESHYAIIYNSQNEAQQKLIFALTELCGLMYVHSINRFMSDTVHVSMLQLLTNNKIKTIWDVHGAVPEEYLMYGSELGRDIANDVESFFYHHADVIVVVNNAMRRHLVRKHGESSAKFVVLPIFNIDVTKRHEGNSNAQEVKETLEIVYAGGTQKWQNVELMQEIMQKTGEEYSYKMFVPNPDEFNSMWKGKKPKKVVVDSKSPEELAVEYAACDYGFVLRDADVVNYVACPTKIIEYIQNGIVPILKSEEIGDFVELGMQYVDYETCLHGQLPSRKEAQRMAKENYAVLDAMHQSYIHGIQSLKNELACRERIFPTAPPAIGLVVTTFDKGGLEQIVLYLYQGYKKAGYRTYLLCQKDILGSMAEQIDCGDLLVFHDSEDEFISLLCEHHITTLHYHYNVFALEKMSLYGVKTIYTMHNTYIWKSTDEIREYAGILKYADCVVPVSSAVENYFHARTNHCCNNVSTIYNGISFEELSLPDLPAHLTRSALGLKDTDITMAFIASYYPAKGQTGMIGVMEQLLNCNPSIKLLLVGNVGSPEFYDNFKRYLDRSPAKGNIIQIDYFEHKYIGEFLRRTVDIFILPTLQEGCSNAVLEAIYCDKPMIVTDVGNARQAEEKASCLVVPTPYPDIVELESAELTRVSMLKDMPNQEDVVNTILKMVDNLPYYKQKAQLSDEQKQIFNVDQMVGSYLKLVDRYTEKT